MVRRKVGQMGQVRRGGIVNYEVGTSYKLAPAGVEATIGATKNGYYKITNKSYRDYQKDSHMGMDFNLYSTIKEEDVLYKFRATKQEIS